MTSNDELSFEQLHHINGAGLKNEYEKLKKPKAAKKIKLPKLLTLKDIMNGGGSPGPYLPKLKHVNDQQYNPVNQMMY